MACEETDKLVVIEGDDADVLVTIKDSKGRIVPVTGATDIEMRISDRKTGGTRLHTPGGAVADGPAGQLRFVMNGANGPSTMAPGDYWFQATFRLAGKRKSALPREYLVVEAL